MRCGKVVIVLTALAACALASAREGDLDTSFNGSGTLAFSIRDAQPAIDSGNALAIQADGKIVVVGTTYEVEPPTSRWTATRINSDGSLDATFGTNGRTALNLGAHTQSAAPIALVIQDDGKIVVGGYYDLHLAIARLNVDGTLDSSFGNGGVWLGNPVGGMTQPYVSTMSLIAQPTGGQMIVFAGGAPTGSGSNFLRGFIDSTGQYPHMDVIAGPLTFSNFNAMVQQGNKFLMVGSSVSASGLGTCSSRRYRLGRSGLGNLQFFADPIFVVSDITFGSGATPQCHLDSTALLPNGDVVLGGHQTDGGSNEVTVAYGLNGADGRMNDRMIPDAFVSAFPTTSVALSQGDGKVILSGTSVVGNRQGFFLQRRLWQSGNQSVDPTFGNAGTATINFDHAGVTTNSYMSATALDRYGRIVAVGTTEDVGQTSVTHVAVMRLLSDVIFRNGFETN
ncbi:MAG: delta-60 repeat domain-containing protein [Dokdonella sp.]